jgi:hypothetical protein
MQQLNPITFKEPPNIKIIKKGDYITITKVSNEDIEKVFNINNKRPIWYIHENNYIATTNKFDDKTTFYYLHQYIINTHYYKN